MENIIDQKISISQGMSGHFAVHLVLIKDDQGEYWDIQQTGIGRYKTSAEALREAKTWAEAEEIPLAKHLLK